MIGIDLMNRIGRLIVGKLRPIVVEKISRPVRRINWARKGVDHHIVGKDRPKVGNSRQMLNVNPLERNISPVEVGNNLRLMKRRSPRRNINVKICHQVAGMCRLIAKSHLTVVRINRLAYVKNHPKH
jgi:hypothetical protein